MEIAHILYTQARIQNVSRSCAVIYFMPFLSLNLHHHYSHTYNEKQIQELFISLYDWNQLNLTEYTKQIGN